MKTAQHNCTLRSAAWLFFLALTASVSLSGCAAFNKGQVVLARNVTFGQELIDLKQAWDLGAITDEEYVTIKAKVIDLVDQGDIGVVYGDFASGHDHDHDHDHSH